LRAKDLQFVQKAIEELEAALKRAKEKKKLEEEMATMMKVKEMLNDGKHVKDGDWNAKEIEHLNNHLFLTSKPVIYLVNIGCEQYIKKQNSWLPKIQEYIKSHGGGPMIPYSAEFESQVVAGNEDDKEA